MKPRPRASDELLAHLASRLTDRDRHLCRMLWDHRVFTTHQIREIAFDSLITAEHRLVTLYRLRVLDRFRPLLETGSAPFHYVLDEMGASVIAAERGIDVKKLGYRRDKALRIAYSQRLDHTVGVNGFFTALIAAARHDPCCRLIDWWSERRCHATWGELVRPDGYGYWRDHGHETDFFLEYDRGTETLDRVAAKLNGYQDLQQASQRTTPVLFSLPSTDRERALRDRLRWTPVPVATTNRTFYPEPTGAAWLLLKSQERCRLSRVGARTTDGSD